MEQRNYLKVFCAVAFIAFAAVSCWATVESLHLLLPSIPVVFVWILTIGFFFIASWGSKMIVDSLNKNVYTENPGLKLLGGVFIMLIFWLICSMPTNTHTFFYKDTIKDVAITDLETTMGYLVSLEKDEVAHAKIEHDWAIFQNEVWGIFEELRIEVKNPSRPGIAEQCENILLKLDGKLGVKVGRISPKSNNLKGWNEVLEQYRTSITNILEKKKQEYADRYIGVSDKDVKKRIATNKANIKKVLNDIHKMSSINDQVMINAGLVLTESYALIGKYSDRLDLKDADKQVYTGNAISKTARMLSVWDVWMDFFNGKIARGKFIFWIIISILVDIAGFIFFDMAFKKED